jgi:hypothetical protein
MVPPRVGQMGRCKQFPYPSTKGAQQLVESRLDEPLSSPLWLHMDGCPRIRGAARAWSLLGRLV